MEPGDVTRDGYIYLGIAGDHMQYCRYGSCRVNMKQALMAMRYGWHVSWIDPGGFIVHIWRNA